MFLTSLAPNADGNPASRKLKQMSKKKASKGGSGLDPQHEAYVLGLKSITSSLVDVEFLQTEYRLFALAGEAGGQVTIYAIEQEG